MKKVKKEKKPMNVRGIIGGVSSALIVGALTGITLVFPQTYFGYERTLENSVDGVFNYISEDTTRINELKDVGYLNSGISFKEKTPTTKDYSETYDIMFSSEAKTLTADDLGSPSMIWAKQENVKIAEVSQIKDTTNWEISKDATGNYSGIDGLQKLFFKKPITNDVNSNIDYDGYYQTLLSPSITKKDSESDYIYNYDKTGDFYLYKLNTTPTPKTEDPTNGFVLEEEVVITTNKALMMFVTNPSIASDLGGTFSYSYYPWGEQTFMEPLFESNDLDLIMGISFLTFIAVLAGTITMTVKFAKNERPNKASMALLATSLAVATGLSASLVSVITGGIATILVLGLIAETSYNQNDGYKQDQIEKVEKTIRNLKEQIESAESKDSKEFYEDKLVKANKKLASTKAK